MTEGASRKMVKSRKRSGTSRVRMEHVLRFVTPPKTLFLQNPTKSLPHHNVSPPIRSPPPTPHLKHHGQSTRRRLRALRRRRRPRHPPTPASPPLSNTPTILASPGVSTCGMALPTMLTPSQALWPLPRGLNALITYAVPLFPGT